MNMMLRKNYRFGIDLITKRSLYRFVVAIIVTLIFSIQGSVLVFASENNDFTVQNSASQMSSKQKYNFPISKIVAQQKIDGEKTGNFICAYKITVGKTKDDINGRELKISSNMDSEGRIEFADIEKSMEYSDGSTVNFGDGDHYFVVQCVNNNEKLKELKLEPCNDYYTIYVKVEEGYITEIAEYINGDSSSPLSPNSIYTFNFRAKKMMTASPLEKEFLKPGSNNNSSKDEEKFLLEVEGKNTNNKNLKLTDSNALIAAKNNSARNQDDKIATEVKNSKENLKVANESASQYDKDNKNPIYFNENTLDLVAPGIKTIAVSVILAIVLGGVSVFVAKRSF